MGDNAIWEAQPSAPATLLGFCVDHPFQPLDPPPSNPCVPGNHFPPPVERHAHRLLDARSSTPPECACVAQALAVDCRVEGSSPSCGAIFESRQEGRPAGKRNPERRELLGVLHLGRNGAGMREVVASAGRSPSCAGGTREAASRWSWTTPRAVSAGSSPGESGSRGAARFTQRPVV
jgi:hypothetical protein